MLYRSSTCDTHTSPREHLCIFWPSFPINKSFSRKIDPLWCMCGHIPFHFICTPYIMRTVTYIQSSFEGPATFVSGKVQCCEAMNFFLVAKYGCKWRPNIEYGATDEEWTISYTTIILVFAESAGKGEQASHLMLILFFVLRHRTNYLLDLFRTTWRQLNEMGSHCMLYLIIIAVDVHV